MTVKALRVESLHEPIAIDAPRPRFSWQLESDRRGERQTAYEIVVTAPGADARDASAATWSTGKVSSAENFDVEYAGPALVSGARYTWRVRAWDREDRPSEWSAPSSWQMGLLTPGAWKAKWIGGGEQSPRLRSEFAVARHVTRATAYASAVGWYRLAINGTELDERVLSPINSNYPKAFYYDAYDVTALLRPGANAIGLWLGHGYNQEYSKYGFRWDVPVAGIAQLEIVYDDGTTETIGTDEHWKWHESPIVADGIYHGETFDARRDEAGWSSPGFADHAWKPCVLREIKAAPLRATPFPGLVVTDSIRPVNVTEPKPGVFVFDLGQNIAGWTQLSVQGPAGTTVVLCHAEDIHPDGTLDVTTNRAARATDTYILRGGAPERYEPRFTYHGFRYVEVTGYPGRPGLTSITGRAIRAAVEPAGEFECSEPLLNRMHRNFRWSIANNLVGIPTDTATRDERTPCQMDSLAVEDAAISNFDMNAYYAKWLADIAGDGGSLPNWNGDQVVLPFLLHEYYGDQRILAEHYENMKHVVDRFASTAESGKYWESGYGDWATANQRGDYETSFSEGEIVNTAFWFRCTRIVGEVARLLGKTPDAETYAQRAEEIRTAFNRKHFHAESATYGSGRQVTSILPLAFGMVDDAHRSAVVAALRRRIETVDHHHLDTGIFGTRYLFDVLIDAGLGDLALKVLLEPGYPGFVDQIEHGATTTWEQWAFRGGNMQTHDHAMFAGADATFFTRLGGILPATPGYREVAIRPAFISRLDFVHCARETPMGRVECNWKRNDGTFSVRVRVPANTTARVYLPASSLEQITERGASVASAKGIEDARLRSGTVEIVLGSGEYEFVVAKAGDRK